MTATPKQSPRALVVAWDVAHNAAGRAHVLYQLLVDNFDVVIAGPVWQVMGGKVWPPLEGTPLPLSWFHVESLDDVVSEAEQMAVARPVDVVVISKPMLPSLLFGIIVANRCGAKLILDIDDDELAFLDEADWHNFGSMSADHLLDVLDPEKPWKAPAVILADRLAAQIETRTVASVPLQERFGGTLVRHARNLADFDEGRASRDEMRVALGVSADTTVLGFAGTPAPTKASTNLLKSPMPSQT